MRSFPSRFLHFSLAALTAACGGSGSSPTSPTLAPTVAATRTIGLSGSLTSGDVTVGQSREATLTVANTGTGPLTITGLASQGTGLTTHFSAVDHQ